MSSFLILMSLNFQSCQEATSPEKYTNTFQKSITNQPSTVYQLKKVKDMTLTEKREFSTTIQRIAKGLALLLDDLNNKKILETAINESRKKEHILEASEFLNRNYFLKIKGEKIKTTFGKAIAQYLPNSIKAKFDKRIKNLPFGSIDILLPSEEYRNNWKYTDIIQVAGIGWNEKIKKPEATIYKTDGTNYLYKAKQKPIVTTLVVNASEKQGNYYDNLDDNFDLQKNNSVKYEFWVGGAKVAGYYDDWWDPKMEVYFEFRIQYGYSDGTWGNWTGWRHQWQSGTRDCTAYQWKSFNNKIMHTSVYLYHLKLRMLDSDTWSSDDIICDGTIWEFSDGTAIPVFYHSDEFSNYVYIKHSEHESKFKTIRN